ncbi:PepSY-associated TM helix domain-containing protein [Nevskia ramosa]|uniref:PepSY-associated TM helix domain-containing protein n=1 Tax=Nevskia ramosa TaxID=64002 RepID=UPI003D133E19
MEDTFRKSMGWLHTWTGVVLGSVMFAMFWMGSLSVFDREIDRWMMPATRLAAAPADFSLDRSVVPIARELAAASPQWGISLPTERTPVLRLNYVGADKQRTRRDFDPTTGALIADQGTLGGTGFIYPFHYMLHIKWRQMGYWIVGVTAIAMLVLLVSGVIIHKKIFIDFFLFRPKKQLQRASLDLHNLSGVLGLPFHFVMVLSGLIIFMGIYFPTAPLLAYADAPQTIKAFTDDAYGRYNREKANQPGTLASLDAMIASAEQQWQGGRPFFVRVINPADANAVVEVRRSSASDITVNLDQIYFDGTSGAVLSRFEAAPVMTVQRFISGLHLVQFKHWTLRWIYFVLGLSGCVMIATGFIFWLEARRASHAKKGLKGVRIIEALTVGSVTGIIASTAMFLVANRLLPLDAQWLGYERPQLETGAFYLLWLASFAHAALRPRRAWCEQTGAIAVLAALAVLLDALTTHDHLSSVMHGQWAAVGMDAVLLFAAAIAAFAGRHMAQRKPIQRAVRSPSRNAELEHG